MRLDGKEVQNETSYALPLRVGEMEGNKEFTVMQKLSLKCTSSLSTRDQKHQLSVFQQHSCETI